MTTATPDGRRLRLEVEGIDPFLVDPLPARRGLALSRAFVRASLNRWADDMGIEPLEEIELDRIFVEALGLANYERLTGELRDPVTFEPITEEQAGRPRPAGEPMRHKEIQEVCLAAFYWQTVVGEDAVQVFLESDTPEAGALKALDLLLVQLGLSLSRTLLLTDEVHRTPQQVVSSGTSTPPSGVKPSVLLPARPSDHLKKKPRRRRK